MADEIHSSDPVLPDHKRFYSSFIGLMKWSVVGIALLLIALAIFLVR